MSTIEERLQALEREHQTLEREHRTLEREHTELKQKIELQTIAIGALVNKAALEKLNEKYDRLFETLINHDNFTNGQLAEIREQHTELDGKVVGLQTEMRQRFAEQAALIGNIQSDVSNLKSDVSTLKSDVSNLKSDVSNLKSDVSTLKSDVSNLKSDVSTVKNNVQSLITGQQEQAALLAQILERLPK